MEIRTTKPSNNKFYITKSKGGYSECITGKPTDSKANVLANCVGYACGRFNEIIGSMKYPKFYCNAEKFINVAKNYGLQISDVPTLGGIMVWQKGTQSSSDGAGHVAIVERIDSKNQIYTSESSYNGKAFYNSTRTNNNAKWGAGSGYTFLGCIVNPKIGKVTTPTTDKKSEMVLKTLARNTNLRTAPNLKSSATLYLANTTLYVIEAGCSKVDGYTWDKVKIRVTGKTGYMINKNYK